VHGVCGGEKNVVTAAAATEATTTNERTKDGMFYHYRAAVCRGDMAESVSNAIRKNSAICSVIKNSHIVQSEIFFKCLQCCQNRTLYKFDVTPLF